MLNNDTNYANSRYTGSYVLTNIPDMDIAFVHSIDGHADLDRASVNINNEATGQIIRIRANQLIYTLPQLGYVQTNGEDDISRNVADNGVKFIQRMPMRRDWKQGLRASQLRAVIDGRQHPISSEWFRRNIKGITNTLRNQYPDWKTSLDLCEEWKSGVALSRNFAILSNFTMAYRGYVFGRLNMQDRVQITNNRFNFVIEAFQQEVSNNALAA